MWLQLERGKVHGTVDTGLSVIACKKKGRRIDVDADDLIYHLKVSLNDSVSSLMLPVHVALSGSDVSL